MNGTSPPRQCVINTTSKIDLATTSSTQICLGAALSIISLPSITCCKPRRVAPDAAAEMAWPCSPEKYRLLEQISDRVHRAQICLTEETVAIKCYNLEELFEDPCGLSSVCHGLSLLRGSTHRNIIQSKTVFATTGYEGRPPELWVIMPYMACGSLAQVLQMSPDKRLDETSTAFIMKEVAHALAYLHALDIWHRSLTAEHILIGEDMSIAITGMRYAVSSLAGCTVQRRLHDFLPDKDYLPYAAPEYLRQSIDGYTKDIDVYSIGVLTAECLTGSHPFRGLTPPQMLLVKLSGHHAALSDAKLWTKTTTRFVIHCNRSTDRLSAHMLLSHPFIKAAPKKAPSSLQKIGKSMSHPPQPLESLDIEEPDLVVEPFSRKAFQQFHQGGLSFMRAGREVSGSNNRINSTHTEPESPLSPWSPVMGDAGGIFDEAFEEAMERDASHTRLVVPDVTTVVKSGDGRNISISVSPTGSICSIVSNEEYDKQNSISSIQDYDRSARESPDSDDDLQLAGAVGLFRPQQPTGLQRVSSTGHRDPFDKTDLAVIGAPLTVTKCVGECDHRDCNCSINSPISPLSIADPNLPWNLTPVVTSPRRDHVVSPLALHVQAVRMQSDPGYPSSPLANAPVTRQTSEATVSHSQRHLQDLEALEPPKFKSPTTSDTNA